MIMSNINKPEFELVSNWEYLTFPYICGLLAENPSEFSQTLHNSGYQKLQLPFTYYPFKISKIENAITAMRELGIRGFSITIPFKETCIPLIDELSSEAQEIGAVNTIINTGELLYGINTDWIGVTEALKESTDSFNTLSCLVIGAGGAAKAAIFALKKLAVSSITVVNRTDHKAEMLAQKFSVHSIKSDDLINQNLENYDLIINASPAQSISFFPYQSLTSRHSVFEMITGETSLTKTTIKTGGNLIPGIRMLLHQGLEQFILFTEKQAPVQTIESALENKYVITQ